MRIGLEQPAHLGGDDVFISRISGQRAPEPAFRQPQPVVRRGVEVAHATFPRAGHSAGRFVVRRDAEKVAEAGRAKPEFGQPKAGRTDGTGRQVRSSQAVRAARAVDVHRDFLDRRETVGELHIRVLPRPVATRELR